MWKVAIDSAKEMIASLEEQLLPLEREVASKKRHILRLKGAIRFFEECIRTCYPWPGEK